MSTDDVISRRGPECRMKPWKQLATSIRPSSTVNNFAITIMNIYFIVVACVAGGT